MKFLLILVVLVVAVWLWRASRRNVRDASQREDSASAPPQIMVSCALCQVHIAQAEAIAGQHGLYCSLEHRRRAEP